jgi:hypothetical protein
MLRAVITLARRVQSRSTIVREVVVAACALCKEAKDTNNKLKCQM